jgi:hypothetical protein
MFIGRYALSDVVDAAFLDKPILCSALTICDEE